MGYQVNLTHRALHDLASIYRRIEAEISSQSLRWFNGLEKAINSLQEYPNRSPVIPEDKRLRHLLYGKKPHVYRIIYEFKEDTNTGNVLHIRSSTRDKMPKQ